ncbi:MAG: cbb3-type cytochrome c oxidase subunit I [Acidobacteria bacterium]|nr:cbb3-type cytochrome c oxidase subunit I [Acidobacteriota bacterium]MCI0625445.1 cbb3-type cytochrome c oxidase subunit I [Acidobacteriota bacterium]
MSETPHAHAVHAAPTGFIWKYVFSLDHKIIGLQYYFLALIAVFLGMGLSVIFRLRLAWPTEQWPLLAKIFPAGFEGGPMTPEFYLSMVTMHGTIMVFFVLTTAPQSGFGNYFLPIQIGAHDMAFPVLNMLSFWVTFVSMAVMVAALFVTGGAPISGWTAYAPLSALGEIAGPGQGLGQTLWIISIAIFCLASLLGALNFITTVLNMRAKGMSLMRMPLTVWTWLTTAILALLSFPVLLAGGILLLFDRLGGTSFFIPAGLVVSDKVIQHAGGSPILWQHLFWFFGHPEVYIAILPGMGVTSQLLSTFARKPIYGYRAMVYAVFAIGLLGFFVWGHHMFMSGLSPMSALVFSMLTLTIGVPSAVKTFNWLGTLWGGKIRFTTASLYAIGFVSLFVSGGITGIFLGQTSVDIPLHDTYFPVGHFHLIMGVASIFGIFGATYYWFPKMFGRMMNEAWGKLHFWLTFIGVNAIFMPMHVMGIMGHPRRYAQGTEFQYLAGTQAYHVLLTWAAIITALAQFIFLLNFFWSLFKGKKASDNPWEATTLEWTIPSPPPHDNFAGRIPVVHHGPYEYGVPGAPRDFVMQNDPPLKVGKA